MGTYFIPRDPKGEGRILFIFSRKSLMYTTIGAGIGLAANALLSQIHLGVIGIGITVILGALGFVIGTFKVPEMTAFDVTKKTGGEKIDDVIIRAIKFKLNNKNKIYIYKEEENKGD